MPLRLRVNAATTRKAALKVVKELDAFPKVPESYQQTTAAGGGVSLLVFALITILVMSEIRYYSSSELSYEHTVDTEVDGKLKLNVDITIAMQCKDIGADVMDMTGENSIGTTDLSETPTYFELSPKQARYMQMIREVNEYVKNEYHAIHDFLWQSGYTEDQPSVPHDACRLRGSFTVNKVAGNFHITAGKALPGFPLGHAHLTATISENEYNFTHRINQFSFGETTAGLVNPLDGEEKVVTENRHIFQYFVKVVPTNVKTWYSSVDTCQYSVTERNRTINHSKGSHGLAGIFFKYDLAPIKVIVKESRKPFWQFPVRLCGIIGGVFATSGILHGIVGYILDCAYCTFGAGDGRPARKDAVRDSSSSPIMTSPPAVFPATGTPVSPAVSLSPATNSLGAARTSQTTSDQTVTSLASGEATFSANLLEDSPPRTESL